MTPGPVLCARPGCGVPYPDHPTLAFGCPGFLWVPPPSPRTPSNRSKPRTLRYRRT
jgi:hypothetical protein